jgi:hypothetical protein
MLRINIVIALMVCLSPCPTVLAVDDPFVIFKSNRAKCDIYHCRLEIESEFTRSGIGETPKHVVEIWRDGQRIRIDTINTANFDELTKEVFRSTLCRDCIARGFTDTYSFPRSRVIRVKNNDVSGAIGPTDDVFDARVIGLSMELYGNWHIDQQFGILTNQQLKRSLMTQDGDVLIVKGQLEPDRGEMVIRHDLKNSCRILDIQHSGEYKNSRWNTILRNEYPDSPTSEVWYPSRVIRESVTTVDGVTHRSKQVVKVIQAAINQPIDPSVFTYAGFGIVPSAPMVLDPSRPERRHFWDGHAVVDVLPPELTVPTKVWSPDQKSELDPVPAGELRSQSKWPYYLAGGILVITGIVLYLKRLT